MNIDEIAQNIVSSFNADDTIMLKMKTKDMLRQINSNESMFSVVQHPYLVAKSLYFMLTEDYLTEDEQISVIKLVYFCLLNNYLKNSGCKSGEAGYEDLVSGCKLALVMISMQNQYLKYSIISGQARYINPETHIRNQILLFGGIAKEAEIAHCTYPLEDVINSYFVDIFNELYRHFPIGRDLAILKENCTPVIKNIKNSISINLKESWLEDF
jgi:hypothetical protein